MNFNLLNHGIINMDGHIYDVADMYDMVKRYYDNSMGRYNFDAYYDVDDIVNPYAIICLAEWIDLNFECGGDLLPCLQQAEKEIFGYVVSQFWTHHHL